jgi:polygalacturonase
MALLFLVSIRCLLAETIINVRDHGAKGDGTTLDSPAINAAIAAVTHAGGGTVVLPAGRYLSFSIRLQSNLTLQLDEGAVLVAATPSPALGQYDPAEPNESSAYQDFGHSHWHNSLIWGEGLENVSIIGPGRINGTSALTRMGPPAQRDPESAPRPGKGDASTVAPTRRTASAMEGQGNKAIALKNCRHVTMRNFSILNGGHFALLATGVDHLSINHVIVDTNRDGFDIDSCREVTITECRVNSPHDDAIVLKTSFALGVARSTENVTISRCFVSGYDIGTLLDGTRQRTLLRAPDRDGPTGRIKIGTESNGDFRHIIISDCTFERSRGLALESVDGAVIDDVVATRLTMREVTNAPIFLRLGNRARGPAGTPIGALRNVQISHVVADGVDGRFPITLAGLPDHPIENVTLSDIRIASAGGITQEQVAAQPTELTNAFFLRGTEPGVTGPRNPFAVPERATAYPEPSMFGLLPASIVFARHVTQLTLQDVTASLDQPDTRSRIVLEDAAHVTFERVTISPSLKSAGVTLRQFRDLRIHQSFDVPDISFDRVDERSL